MKIAIVIVIVLLILIGLFIFIKSRPAKIIPITQLLDEEVKKYSRNFQPAIAIGVYKQGKVVFKNYGDQISNQTIFQIGSVSKLLTASSFQILVDQEQLSYNTTLADLLSDLPLDSRLRSISLLDLATHSSGLPSVPKPLMDYVEQQAGKDNVSITPYSYLNEQMMLDYLQNPIDLNNKKVFAYSNYGMGLLGYLLARSQHSSYEDVVKSRLLDPLNMSNTFIRHQATNELIQGHRADGKTNPAWTFGALEAAGAFNSNTQDMMKFIIANLDQTSPLHNSLIKTHIAQKGGETGIGWMQPNAIDKLAGNSDMLWHNGMVGGFASYIAIDKQEQTGLIFLSNHAIDTTMVGTMIMRRLKNAEFNE